MDTMDETIGELIALSDTKGESEWAVRATFHRACSCHYHAVVRPELERFEQHLKRQEILVAVIPIQSLDQHLLQAGLVIEFPVDTTNLLEIRYDFLRRTLAFSQLFAGYRNGQPDHQFSFASLEVASLQLHDIVESFVSSVLELQVAKRS